VTIGDCLVVIVVMVAFESSTRILIRFFLLRPFALGIILSMTALFFAVIVAFVLGVAIIIIIINIIVIGRLMRSFALLAILNDFTLMSKFPAVICRHISNRLIENKLILSNQREKKKKEGRFLELPFDQCRAVPFSSSHLASDAQDESSIQAPHNRCLSSHWQSILYTPSIDMKDKDE
jgi:hypothetical protein